MPISDVGMLTRLESLESRSFFSITGKEFLDFRESTLATVRQQAYCEQDSCYLSLDRLFASPQLWHAYQTLTPQNKRQWCI